MRKALSLLTGLTLVSLAFLGQASAQACVWVGGNVIARIFFTLWLAITPAFAGSMLLLGAGGSRPLPAPVFVGNGPLSNSSGTWTSSTVNIGAAYSTRRVIVMAVSGLSSGRTITSGSINGVAATTCLDSTRSTQEWAGCITAVVPTGTTNVTVTFTMSNTLFGPAQYAVYTVDDSSLLSSTPQTGTAGTASGTSVAPTVSQTAGGFVLGGTAWGNGSAKSGSISGYTIDAPNGNTFLFFSLIPSPSTGTATATTTWTGSFSANSGVTAWR